MKDKVTSEGITPQQLKTVLRLLEETGLTEKKEELLQNVSDGRVSKENMLLKYEAVAIIDQLTRISPFTRLRAAIWQLAMHIGIIWGETPEDEIMNAIVLDNYLLKKGAVKKRLQHMHFEQLMRVHRQFELMIYGSNKANEKEAEKLTSALLDELNIIVK